MGKRICIFFFLLTGFLYGQDDHADQVEKRRLESGVDPTRVASQIVINTEVIDPDGSPVMFGVFTKLKLATPKNWYFQFEGRFSSAHNGANFYTGFGDFKFTLGNLFLKKGSHSLGADLELTLPVGSQEFGVPRGLIFTPSLMYTVLFAKSFIFAIQPKYAVSAWTRETDPFVNMLQVRIFFAGFTKKGVTAVLEARPIYDFTASKFNMIISPILSVAVGGKTTFHFLIEFPVIPEFWLKQGPLYRLGMVKSF